MSTEVDKIAKDPFSDVVPERVWLDLSNVCKARGMVKLTLTVNGVEKELYHSYVIDGTVCHGFNLTWLIRNAVAAERVACEEILNDELRQLETVDCIKRERVNITAWLMNARERIRGRSPRATPPEGKGTE